MRKRKINSLYIHIPFCRHICPYCDFTKLIKNQDFEISYTKKLEEELTFLKSKYSKFTTIYIGGGTPSCLSIDNLNHLLEIVSKLKSSDCEFSIECNPEDISEELLKLFCKYGVNRISIGIQTFDSNMLDSIGRNYHIDFTFLIQQVKKYIRNINLDFIYGLPNYTKELLSSDLNTLFSLDVTHASFYSLIVSPGTIYFNKGIKEINDDKSREYYDLILNEMRNHGFKRYEVSNFAKQNFECKHNLTYWHNEEYVGIGLGASGYENGFRYTNSLNLDDYLKGNKKQMEHITNKSLKEYYFITNLRLSDGFSLFEYKKNFNEDFVIKYNDVIQNLLSEHLCEIKNDRFYCTDEGIMLLDRVLLQLM
jgi:putative oxygen-independent coproporphyrinogen III oxidase